MNWDEGPYFQAERVDIHREVVRNCIDDGKAYYCTCTSEELDAKRKKALAEGRKPKYDGTCRDHGIAPNPRTRSSVSAVQRSERRSSAT